MKYESSFKSEADNLEISIMAVIPDKKPYRAVVQLVHGISGEAWICDSDSRSQRTWKKCKISGGSRLYIRWGSTGNASGYPHSEQKNPCILSGTSADTDGAQYGFTGSEGVCGRT